MPVSGYGLDPALAQLLQRPKRVDHPNPWMPALSGYGFPQPARPIPQLPQQVMFRGASVPPRPDVGATTAPVIPGTTPTPVPAPAPSPIPVTPGPVIGGSPGGTMAGARQNALGHWIRTSEPEPYPGYGNAFRAGTAKAKEDWGAAGTNAGSWEAFLGNWRRQRPGWLQGNYNVVAPAPAVPGNDLQAELERLFSGASGDASGFAGALRALLTRSSGRPAATPQPVAPPPQRET